MANRGNKKKPKGTNRKAPVTVEKKLTGNQKRMGKQDGKRR